MSDLQKLDPALVEKMNAWANLGKNVTEIIPILQAQSQKLILANPLPTDKEQIPTYEAALKDARKATAESIEQRKAITGKFDNVIAKLMEPEKATTAHFVQYADALLKLKQQIAEDERKKQAAIDEVNRIKIAFTTHINQKDAQYKTMIAMRIADAYKRALEGECPTEDTREFLAKEKAEFAPEYGFAKPNLASKPVYADAEQVQAIWDSLEKPTAQSYHDLFWYDLTSKFELTYGIALKHKGGSIAQAEREALEKSNAATKEAMANTTMATMETASVVSGTQTKAIKSVWEVNMPFGTPEEGKDSARRIAIAFFANLGLCEGGVRASWDKLTITQMHHALSWAKNKDEKFEATGIVFLKKDKL